MSEVEAAWFAGVFDGEGSVGWPRRDYLHTVRIQVANTNKLFLDRIAIVCGTGKIREITKYRANPRHSASWTWDCYGENARIVLRQILPWLIIKKEAAEVALGLRRASEPPLSQRTRTTRAATAAEENPQ